ncbi:MAG: PorP/SprF family type IX secretion system membrane protein [Bacteroidota bacterium]
MRTITQLFTLCCLGGFFLFSSPLQAQQLPNFVNQFHQPGIYNPARLHDGTISALYRRQWLDLPTEEAPVSYFVHADLSQLLKLGDKRIGLGLQFIGDQAFVINTNRIGANFAYHIINEPNRRLSAGIQVGFLSQSLEFGEARVNNPFDLELLSGSFSNGSFDGGPGIHYFQQFASGTQLELDLSALQLYSDRVDQDNGSSFDLQRHLMVRAAIKFPVGDNAAIEPVAQFRQGIDEFSLKSDQFDLGLRAHFLDRFVVGLGTRLAKDVSVFNLSFAVDVGGPVGVMGAYETNPIFGGTYEAGLYLDTRPSDVVVPSVPDDPSVAGGDGPRRPRRVNIRSYQQEVDQLLDGAFEYMDAVDMSLPEIETRLNQAENNTLERDIFLDQAESKLNEAGNALNQARNGVDQANGKYLEAREALGDQATSDRKYQEMGTDLGEADNRLRQQGNRYNTLVERLEGLRVNLADYVRAADLPSVQNYFQEIVNASANSLPPDMEEVVVREGAMGSMEVDFAFPRSQSQFDLNDATLSDVRLLVQIIGTEARKAQNSGLVLSNIHLMAELDSPEDDLRLFANAGNYDGEYGASTYTFRYDFKNMVTNNLEPRRAVIQNGPVDLLELTALQLDAMRRALVDDGINTNQLQLTVFAPVAQDEARRFIIRMIIRR